VLLTHSKQFRGCEADVVILLSRYGSYGDGMRSGLTRGVASLCLIFDDDVVDVEELRKLYNVIHF